jgi:uncharacterized membrane protein YkoI
MNSNSLTALIFTAGMLAVAIPHANAETGGNEAKELQAVQSAKISVEDAAKAAKSKVDGTVLSVQIYEESGKAAYHVEVVGTDGKQHDLSVDAMTGDVSQMAANQDNDQEGAEGEGANGSQE